jgi:hypothetical protein
MMAIHRARYRLDKDSLDHGLICNGLEAAAPAGIGLSKHHIFICSRWSGTVTKYFTSRVPPKSSTNVHVHFLQQCTKGLKVLLHQEPGLSLFAWKLMLNKFNQVFWTAVRKVEHDPALLSLTVCFETTVSWLPP